MTVHAVTAGMQGTVKTRHRVLRGYARSRQEYDQRRRSQPLDAQGKAYARLLRGDPCSYCMTFCGQMAADHIDGLKAERRPGENVWSNLTAAGRPCNAAKREKPLLLFLLERRPAPDPTECPA